MRIAETDTHYASNAAYVNFTTLLAPTGTSVTSGDFQIEAGEGVSSVLPESTYMMDENGEPVDDCPVCLTWVSDREYTGEEGTYVFTAEPDGDYSKRFDFSNVKWPVRTVTVKASEPIKSLDGQFFIFEDSSIGTQEGAISASEDVGVVTLHPILSLKPVKDEYLLPVSIYSEYMIDLYDLTWNNEAGDVYASCIRPEAFTGTYLQFYVVLDNDAEGNIGAAFYMDYDGDGTKYAKSDLIKVDISRITFLPTDAEVADTTSTFTE